MKVKLCARQGFCELIREPGDPRFSGTVGAKGESRLLYHLKQILNRRGYNLVKKRMWRDGHLVDEMQQYLRTRSVHSPKPHIYIYNESWAIRGAEEDFCKKGRVRLGVVCDVFKKK